MSLQPNEIEKIAHLARLAISETDKSVYAENLSSILDLVEQMNAVNTADIVPLAHPLNEPQRLRDDVTSETDQRELLQENSPTVEKGLFLVPKVLE